MTRAATLLAGIVIGAGAATAVLVQAQSPRDAVTVSPTLYTTKLDNERVRVLEYTLPPGQTEPMHSHGTFLVRFLGDAQIRGTPAGGGATDSVVKRGDVGWRDPMAHSVQNIGKTPVEAFIVEVKPCGKG
jgi:hypothetical protein